MPRFRRLSLVLPLCAVTLACGPEKDPLAGVSASAGNTSSNNTSNNTGNNTSNSSGDPTDTGGNSGSGTTGGSDHAVCDQYLACVAIVTPDALPASEDSFGPNGTCWMSTPEVAEQCLMSCANGLASLGMLFPGEQACGGVGGTDATTGGMTDATTDITGSTSETSITSGPITSGPMTTGPCNDNPSQPNGSACTDASGCGCASGKCFIVPALGGFCGECLVDADCSGGCTPPDPIAGTGAVCNDGGFGDGCMSDQVCVDPNAPDCATVFQVPGIITVATCGECETNADCAAPTPNCAPDYDFSGFTGVLVCKANGSVPNDGGCNNDAVCSSGFCGQASIMGLLQVGVCGECNSDADCNGGSCTDPQVDLDSGVMIGSECL